MRRVFPLLFLPALALLLSLFAISGCRSNRQVVAASSAIDREFQRLGEEFLTGHLQWRPAQGVALGLHEYDGQTTDYSRASIEAELARGELVLAHPAPLPGARHYYLVLPEGSEDKPTLQRFSTWLQQASQG